MYYIIENNEQFDYLITNAEQRCYVNVITLNDNVHPKLTSPCLVYYKPEHDKGYIIVIDHSEGLNVEFDRVIELLNKYSTVYVLDKKQHLYFLPKTLPLVDINFFKLEKDQTHFITEDYNTLVHKHFYNTFPSNLEINRIIPIVKHFEKCENIYNEITPFIYNKTKHSDYNMIYTDAFYEIEKNGIGINYNTLKNNFELNNPNYSIKHNKIYTYFNLYNITGRPTNHFNNINFAAIPKTGNARASFIPIGNLLVEFDIDGYHVRLISKLNNINLTQDPAHKQLAQLYYNTPSPTEDQVSNGKKLTFKQLYGGIEDKYKNIPFFKATQRIIDEEWEEFMKDGYIELAGGRKLYNNESLKMNKQKLFNYLIQSYETYYNVRILQQLLSYLSDKKSKLVHYTYDSFLLDVDKSEGAELLRNVKLLIQAHFPCKISYGKNYKNMQSL